MVNGPKDVTLDWDAIDWRLHEENVRRLRQRIFKSARDGSLATVRNLQKLMLRSWSNTLVSVRQATQLNAGRKTAGVDGEVALTPRARMELAVVRVGYFNAWTLQLRLIEERYPRPEEGAEDVDDVPRTRLTELLDEFRDNPLAARDPAGADTAELVGLVRELLDTERQGATRKRVITVLRRLFDLDPVLDVKRKEYEEAPKEKKKKSPPDPET
jgi:N-terminal domain of reverse transcriptase